MKGVGNLGVQLDWDRVTWVRMGQSADLAWEVGAVLEFAQIHGKCEGASHEHQGEEGCVGQGLLRFGHDWHIGAIIPLQWMLLEDLQQKSKVGSVPDLGRAGT